VNLVSSSAIYEKSKQNTSRKQHKLKENPTIRKRTQPKRVSPATSNKSGTFADSEMFPITGEKIIVSVFATWKVIMEHDGYFVKHLY
jgi:hypothetical protein